MSTGTAPPTRTAAVTGAGSGLGREVATGLAAKGYRVFGTARRPAEIEEVQAMAAGVEMAIADVAEPVSADAWIARVSAAVGDAGLGLLISNAGILTPGPMETLSIDAIRHEFEVNVFGGLRVINGLLPALRRARGRIVQIGSMTGRFPLPFNGPSSASKAALEAFADVYRGELGPSGVDFVMIQPGNMATGGPAKTAAALERAASAMSEEHRAVYGDAFAAFAVALRDMQNRGLPAGEAAAQVIAAAERTPAPIRVPVGEDAEEILALVHERSDEQLDALRLQLTGLARARGRAL